MVGILISKEPFAFTPLPDDDPEATHELLKDGDDYVVRELNKESNVKDGE